MQSALLWYLVPSPQKYSAYHLDAIRYHPTPNPSPLAGRGGEAGEGFRIVLH
jgi:hypothetical protein